MDWPLVLVQWQCFPYEWKVFDREGTSAAFAAGPVPFYRRLISPVGWRFLDRACWIDRSSSLFFLLVSSRRRRGGAPGLFDDDRSSASPGTMTPYTT
jgi:hypothetical protein